MKLLIFLLNDLEAIAGVLSNTLPDAIPFYEDTFTERLDGSEELNFSVPTVTKGDFAITDYLINEALIIFRTRYGLLKLMRVMDIEESSVGKITTKNVMCESASVAELSRTIVRPFNYVYDNEKEEGSYVEYNFTTLELFQQILQGSIWKLGRFELDITSNIPYTLDTYENAYKLLLDVATLVEVELEFRVEFDGINFIRYLDVYKQRGSHSNMTFSYGIDLTEVTRTIKSEETINGILALGKAGSDGKRLTITSATDPINPIFAHDFYIDGDTVFSRWGIDRFGKGRYYVGLFDDSDVTDPNYLLALAQRELEARSVPKIEYSMTVLSLKQFTGLDEYKPVRLGDDLLIIDTSFRPELRLTARVVELTTSYSSVSNEEVILGNLQEVIQDPLVAIKDLKDYVNNKGGQLESKASGAQVETHVADTVSHVTQGEKDNWDSKIEEAPNTGVQYARQSQNWVVVSYDYGSLLGDPYDSGSMTVALNNKVNGQYTIWTGTQAEYDAISVKDPTTLYFITA